MDAIGTTEIEVDGQEVDLKPPWRRVTMVELVKEVTGEEMHPSMPVEEARAIGDRLDIECERGLGLGPAPGRGLRRDLRVEADRADLRLDHPREISPLARVHRDDPTLTERFEVVVAGARAGQRLLRAQRPGRPGASASRTRRGRQAAGDEEAESVDEDYVRALEYGLPPTGGLGIGLDRLVMLIAGSRGDPRRDPLPDDAARVRAAAQEGVSRLTLRRV